MISLIRRWTSADRSTRLATEARTCLANDIHLLLAHEMPGEANAHRHGCEFASFFAHPDGATPPDLLASGLYHEVRPCALISPCHELESWLW